MKNDDVSSTDNRDLGEIFVEILGKEKTKKVDEKLSRYYQFIFKDKDGSIIEITEPKVEEWTEETTSEELYRKRKVDAEYNDKGLKVAEKLYRDDGSLSMIKKYYYQDDGKLARCEEYTKNGILATIITYKYDSNGRLSEEITEVGSGNMVMTVKYFYNNEGLLKEKVIYRMGREDMKIYFDYDNKRRLIKSETFNKDDELEDYERYEYDEDNNPVYEETLLTYPDRIGMEIFQGRYKNNYNNDGNLISRMEKNRKIYFDF